MRIGKFLYFGDFLVIPVAVLLFAWAAYAAGGAAAIPEWGASLVFGAALWTLVEYLIHRYAYHHAPILAPLHDAHHKEPLAFLGVPSFVSSGLILAVCYLPLRPSATVLAAGFGTRPLRSASHNGNSAHPLEFDKIAPVNMDDIEVPAFLRYRS